MSKSQTYIEGTELFSIQEIEETHDAIKAKKNEIAKANADLKKLQEKLKDLFIEHADEVQENCGERGYMRETDDGKFRAIGVEPGSVRLYDRAVKTEELDTGNESEDE